MRNAWWGAQGLAPWLLAAIAASSAACVGEIGSRDGGEGSDDDLWKDPAALCAEKGPMPGPTPRLTRLTHPQYDATVRDLFGVALTPSQAFIDDPTFAGFSNNAAGLLVSDRLARDYRRAAEAVAEAVMNDPAALGSLLPCEPSGDGQACARQLVETFGKRVYRRPLTEAEVEAAMALYGKANGAYEGGDAFSQGVHLVIEGLLQSPHFLYRVELSEALDGDGIIPLSGFEVATRLSYLLWNSMPDEALLAAAEAGELDTPEGVEEQARRLLDDPRAAGPIDDFHTQWLHVKKYEDLSKNAEAYPDWDPGIAADMKEETRRFIRHVALERAGDFRELMTSRTSFVTADLATLYGLDGSALGTEPAEVELDPAQRAGFLTQLGFLASHAYPDKSSPIHRGVFIQRQVLCAELPDPPGNIDTTLPPFEGEIKTTRDAVEVHTSPEACTNCHSLINPAGYALESFDAVGAWRTTENGVALNTAATLPVGDGELQVDGAVDLIEGLAESEVAQRCYLTQWFRYGYGREETPIDACTIDALDERMQVAGYNIKELLVALTQTKTFRYRAVEEVSQ
jgi:hypothetical protein